MANSYVSCPNYSTLMSLSDLSTVRLSTVRFMWLQWCQKSNTSYIHLITPMNSSKVYPLQYQLATCLLLLVKKTVSQTQK